MDGSIVFVRWRQCDLRLTHASMHPPESRSQTASRSVQPFLQGSRSCHTDRPTDRPTDLATPSVTIGRIYVRRTAMRPQKYRHHKVSECAKNSRKIAFLWPPNRAGHYIFVPFLSFFFPRLISAVADWMSSMLPHMVWPYCEFRMQV